MAHKKRKRKNDNHLAEGEVTGHYHEAIGVDVAVFGEGSGRRLEAPNGARVLHQEHKEINLPPGNYESSIVREYDHAAEEAREVAD